MVSARNPARSYGGKIIDVHTHLQLPGVFPIQTSHGPERHRPADYLRSVRQLDVTHVAALVIAPRSDPARTRRMNDSVLELSNTSKGRFFSLCSVHPADGDAALREVDRVAKAGARGLKLHPNTQNFDVAHASVKRIVARAALRHLPVLFDAYSPFDANQPGKFVQLALAVPTARLILAHAHGPRFSELLVYEILARYEWWKRNVWVDLSVIASLLGAGPFATQFLWVLRKVGFDRLLFGSDYPLDDPRKAVETVAGMGFTSEELGRVFYENAKDLFGFRA